MRGRSLQVDAARGGAEVGGGRAHLERGFDDRDHLGDLGVAVGLNRHRRHGVGVASDRSGASRRRLQRGNAGAGRGKTVGVEDTVVEAGRGGEGVVELNVLDLDVDGAERDGAGGIAVEGGDDLDVIDTASLPRWKATRMFARGLKRRKK